MSWPVYRKAFTLIELIMVLGVIGFLSGMMLKVGQGVAERRRIAEAEGALSLLARALESYRLFYGDYPWVDSGNEGIAGFTLYRSLLGELSPEGYEVRLEERNAFIDLSVIRTGLFDRTGSGLSNGATGNAMVGSDVGQQCFIDPWGNPYVYRYEDSRRGHWKAPAYVLLSLGPSGGDVLDQGGQEDPLIPISGLISGDYFESEYTYDNLFAK